MLRSAVILWFKLICASVDDHQRIKLDKIFPDSLLFCDGKEISSKFDIVGMLISVASPFALLVTFVPGFLLLSNFVSPHFIHLLPSAPLHPLLHSSPPTPTIRYLI